jgi:hypothetical protein
VNASRQSPSTTPYRCGAELGDEGPAGIRYSTTARDPAPAN